MNDIHPEGAADVEAMIEEPTASDPAGLGLELPEDNDEAITMLVGELMSARGDADSHLDDLKRVAADFDNFRKRTQRERKEVLGRATEKVVAGLMPVLDSFDAALATEPETDGEQLLYSGMINTRTQLLTALEAEGLEVIPTIGEPFDPSVHEPVEAPTGDGTLMVSEELRRGYTLSGKVLRAALVALEAT